MLLNGLHLRHKELTMRATVDKRKRCGTCVEAAKKRSVTNTLGFRLEFHMRGLRYHVYRVVVYICIETRSGTDGRLYPKSST